MPFPISPKAGGAADPSKNAVVVNMNGGALTSLKAVAGASNIYGGIEINVNGGLIQDSSSGVGAVIGSSNLATNARVWGDVSINVGNSDGDPQPTVTGSILGFGMGTLYGNTSIVVNGGTISTSSSSSKGIFAGANWNGVIEGDTNLTVKDGIISCIGCRRQCQYERRIPELLRNDKGIDKRGDRRRISLYCVQRQLCDGRACSSRRENRGRCKHEDKRRFNGRSLRRRRNRRGQRFH